MQQSTVSGDQKIIDETLISANEWRQGSICQKFFCEEAPRRDFEFWILCTQTCSVVSQRQDVVWVEFIGAKKISKKKSQYTKGANPRLLHVEVSDVGWIEIDISNRFWIKRERLMQEKPSGSKIEKLSPEAIATGAFGFASWISRSYTRLTLSTKINNVIKSSKIDKAIEKIVATHGDDLYGVYISIEENQEDENKDVEDKIPPCTMEVFFVVATSSINKRSIIEKVVGEELNEKVNKDPAKANEKSNLSRKDAAASGHVGVVMTIVPATDWTLDDLSQKVRYSFNDNFSEHNSLDE